ncbi:MAG: translation initiation factor IF-2 subunit gamma [Methanosarcinales archaeon]|nr:translation initiation factor IF-2 subunit gamma [Methanosarcinales archaeon]
MKQPCVNIGTVGHVDHGKTTLVSALSGKWTDTHSEELKRGISIRLGYADATLRKCPECPEPDCYTVEKTCPTCGQKSEELRTVSFVDAPGHETLMATMLSGAAIMDGAVLVIAASETCPQPQTKEHLMALDIIGIENIIIVQNKVDLVSKERLLEHYDEIKEFVKGTVAENAPIIPVSAQQNINIDLLIQTLEEVIPTPEGSPDKPSHMFVARSFDVNKPGTLHDKITGGVVGGTLSQGQIKVGDELEIRPGYKLEQDNTTHWFPIKTTVTNIFAGRNKLKVANPGGLLGIGTLLDPNMTKSDSLTGQVAGRPDTLPPVWEDLTMNIQLLERVVGTSESEVIGPIIPKEPLMLNIGTATTVGIVIKANPRAVSVNLKRPVCAAVDSRIAISRRIGSRWRLIGVGTLVDTKVK